MTWHQQQFSCQTEVSTICVYHLAHTRFSFAHTRPWLPGRWYPSRLPHSGQHTHQLLHWQWNSGQVLVVCSLLPQHVSRELSRCTTLSSWPRHRLAISSKYVASSLIRKIHSWTSAHGEVITKPWTHDVCVLSQKWPIIQPHTGSRFSFPWLTYKTSNRFCDSYDQYSVMQMSVSFHINDPGRCYTLYHKTRSLITSC